MWNILNIWIIRESITFFKEVDFMRSTVISTNALVIFTVYFVIRL